LRNPPDENSRRCIVSGARASRTGLIRLALSPDGVVAPDVRARAPGRGAWLGISRAELEQVRTSGKLRAGLARAFKLSGKGNGPIVPDDLAEQIAAALERDALDRLGLEARAGHLLAGSDRIAEAARKGQVAALYHACDAGLDGRRKLDQAWRVGMDREGSGEQGLVLPVDRHILSRAIGRGNAAHIALTDTMAATRVRSAFARWRQFIGVEDGSAACVSEA